MHTLRLRPFMYVAMGIAITVAGAWSMSAWRASAAVSADESTFVSVSPTRILDTREDIGLPGPFASQVPQDLKVTGAIPTKVGTTVVVPDGATGVVLNVTVVVPTADGFLSIRPADAPGVPTTSSLNFSAGDIIPNSVTVQVPTSGADAGEIEITYDAFGQSGPTTEILVDLVGYTKNAGLASLQNQVNELQAIVNTATAPGAVGQEQIGADAVGTSEIAPNAVTANEIAAGAVGATEIANGAVGPTQIAAGAVGPTQIAPGAVGPGQIEAGAIGWSKLDATTDTGLLPAVIGENLANGDCADPVPIPGTNATAGAQTLVLLAIDTTDDSVNGGWAVRGLESIATGPAIVEVCNYTGVDPQPNLPAFDISFILIGA